MSEAAVRALRIGRHRRRFFILDNAFDAAVARRLHRELAALPVTLDEADRPDTRHVLHFKHAFPSQEWAANPLLAALAGAAGTFLRSRRIGFGALYRVYANVNLYGDYQFAHEDGAGWTVVVFANRRWQQDWGGELILYPDDDAPVSYFVQPRPGRVALFDGMIRHRGGMPSKHCHEARRTLIFKFGPAAGRNRSRRSA